MIKRGMSLLLSSAAAVALTTGFSGAAYAGAGACCNTVEDLQRQIHLLQAQIDELKKEPKGTNMEWKGAPKFSGDGWEFKVRGRVMADYNFQKAEDDLTGNEFSEHGSEFRRARLGVEGKILGATKYKFEVDFADNEVDITDAYLQQKFGPAKITLGQHKTYNSLEEQTSSRYITFVERHAATDAFGLNRRIGIGAGFGGDNWTFNAGAFSTNAGEDFDQEPFALAARATFAPIAEKTKSIHLGAHVMYRAYEDDAGLATGAGGIGQRFRVRPGSHRSDRFISTDELDIDSDLLYGVEAAGVFGPFSIEGEYMRVDTNGYDNTTTGPVGDPLNTNDPSFHGWHVDASVFLTGESRTYKGDKGAFDRVKVANPVNDGGMGAWQLAARYDYIDLEDEGIAGGTQTTYIGGINWHLNNYARLMLNYAYADIEDSFEQNNGFADGDVRSVTIRAQIDW